MKEEWKDVVGYEGFYQTSNLGRVRSVDRIVPVTGQKSRRLKGLILRPSCTVYGHFNVNLSKDGIERSIRVHRIVAEAWFGPYPEGKEVCHGPNGNKDNSITNLSYGTRSENLLHKRRDGTHSGRPVRRSDGVEYISLAVAAEETGCFLTNIRKVCLGQRKSAGGYSWAYLE